MRVHGVGWGGTQRLKLFTLSAATPLRDPREVTGEMDQLVKYLVNDENLSPVLSNHIKKARCGGIHLGSQCSRGRDKRITSSRSSSARERVQGSPGPYKTKFQNKNSKTVSPPFSLLHRPKKTKGAELPLRVSDDLWGRQKGLLPGSASERQLNSNWGESRVI